MTGGRAPWRRDSGARPTPQSRISLLTEAAAGTPAGAALARGPCQGVACRERGAAHAALDRKRAKNECPCAPCRAIQHYKAYHPRPFTGADRARVTLLYSWGTAKYDRLFQGMLENLGFRAQALPETSLADLETGKELIDTGACCPTLFITGGLINFLRTRVAEEARRRCQRLCISHGRRLWAVSLRSVSRVLRARARKHRAPRLPGPHDRPVSPGDEG